MLQGGCYNPKVYTTLLSIFFYTASMIQYPGFDSIALQLGPLAIRWYGLMYLIGFGGGWWLMRRRAQGQAVPCSVAQVDDLLFYGALGVILGGRVGYMLFYSWAQLADEPLRLFYIWQGGMSFHGGFLGVLLAMYLYGRKIGRSFWEIADFAAPVAPVGLGAGRIGNFINGELWGGPTTLPWGMQVDCADPRFDDLCYRQLELSGGTLLTPPLHPSPLYEAFLEGFVLFVVLWVFSAKPRPVRAVSALFLLGYGIFRSIVEMVRLPDSHIDYLAFGWVTMGHVLTLPMILVGVLLLWLAYRRPPAAAQGKSE
jgi:phosphatidylglycerol:prolipoprotein diacylglycerol transferase